MDEVTTRRVFVVQEVLKRGASGDLERAMDLSPAAVYGALEVLIGGKQSILSPAPVITTLRAKLRGFGDDDYLLAVGNPTLIGWATAIAAHENRGRVRMLQWDREARAYIEIAADLYGAGVPAWTSDAPRG